MLNMFNMGRRRKAGMRYLHVGHGTDPQHAEYLGNHTTTSKYNLLTFLPKALFEQYR